MKYCVLDFPAFFLSLVNINAHKLPHLSVFPHRQGYKFATSQVYLIKIIKTYILNTHTIAGTEFFRNRMGGTDKKKRTSSPILEI